MMRFRYIFLGTLTAMLLRPDYTYVRGENLNYSKVATKLYRFLVSCVMPLDYLLWTYFKARLKQYMFAACTPTYTQIERVLRYWYPANGATPPTIKPGRYYRLYAYLYAEDTPKKYLYDGPTPPVYWPESDGNYDEPPTIEVTKQFTGMIDYEQFLADVALLIPFYIPYQVKIVD